MSRQYDQKLFADVYRIVTDACARNAGCLDDLSELDGKFVEEMKTKLIDVFDRIYGAGYDRGWFDAEQEAP